MLRRAVLILTLLTLPAVARGQMTSAHVSVVTVYSQNGRYHLRSVPYDDESPSPRGKTYVGSSFRII